MYVDFGEVHYSIVVVYKVSYRPKEKIKKRIQAKRL